MGAKRFGKWIFLQNKRLFRKPGFLLLLLAVPLFTLALSMLSADAGFSRVVLCGGGDSLSRGLVRAFEEETGAAFSFTVAASEEKAVAAVEAGTADAAWLFPEDLAARLTRFVRSGYREAPGVRVVEREDTVALRLAREKLSGRLYEPCARVLFLSYLRGALGEAVSSLSEEELLSAYDEAEDGPPLFIFEDAAAWIAADSPPSAEDAAGERFADGERFLLAPVRGLLSLLLALSGVAGALFARQEEERAGDGSFALLSPGEREGGRLLLCFLPPFHLGILTLFSLFFAGLWRGSGELSAMGLYLLGCGLFGALLGQLLPSSGALCAAIPLLSLGMLGLCPVFLPPPLPGWLSALFPPTHYLAAFESGGGLGLALYALVLALVLLLLSLLRRGRVPRRKEKSLQKI